MMLRWHATLFLWAQVLAVKEQKFAMEPEDQSAVIGSRVTLPCRVINKAGMVQWTKDDFGLGNLSGYDRYSFVGNTDEGDYSLEIYPVDLEDEATYRCQVGAGSEGEAPIISRRANLSVLIPPEHPRIIQGSHLLTTEDHEIELECVSAGGKPPAEITWVDGYGNVLRDGIEYTIDQTNEVGGLKRYTARSVLKLLPKPEHHNSTFTCQAQNTADKTYRSAHLRLEVKFAPKVSLLTINNNSRILEGENVHMICSVKANPPEVTYRWYINEQLILGDPTVDHVIKNVSQTSHNSVVRCEVQNLVGKRQDYKVLNISYAPRFRSKLYSVQADPGATVTLVCDVDGNPTPNIVWIHEDSGRVVSTSSNLTLTVTQETAGHYFCRASVPGFPDIRAEATVYMKGPPTIISHHTQYGIPGDNVVLECSAFSIPTPQKVIWTFKGEDVVSDSSYSVLENQLTEGIKSTLIIENSHLDHFGVYNCTVSNPYGSDTVEITLKAQKSFPLHSTLIGVMGGIALIVTLGTVLLLCQRKPKKPKSEKLNNIKHAKESEVSSNISDLKLEIEYSGGESEAGSENGTRAGLPLAGPVPIDHRYSQCYSDKEFPPKTDGQNNNGYVPYVDYSRDYTPPASLPVGVSPVPPAIGDSDAVDPRYSAAYGNPYLRLTPESHLPPLPGSTASLSSPLYSVIRHGTSSNLPKPITQSVCNRSALSTHV